MRYAEYAQRLIAKNLDEKKLQMQKQSLALDEIKKEKSKTMEFLESRRRQDEETYLKPILNQFERQKQIVSDGVTEYKEALIEALHAFSIGEGSLLANDLLEEYKYCKYILKDESKSVDNKALSLFEYFLKTEDVLSAAKFLKCRSGSEFSDKYEERRERYLEHMAKYPMPAPSTESDCILGFGEDKDDIIKLFQLCGKIDYRSKPQDYDGTYYSEQTRELVARASIGEFGKLCRHVYFDPPYGFGESDSDRMLLMLAHDRGYEAERSIDKLAKERSL